MRRTLTGIGLWIGAAIIAVVVAFQGVNVVGDQVTDERPAALAASDIEERLAAAATSTTSSTSSTSRPVETSTISTEPTSTVPATAVPPPTSTGVAPTTTASQGETRTYELSGGTAVLRFSPAGVDVVFATPEPGFSVEQEPEHGNGVKVEFESESHESRVEGWWDGGPRDRVEEGGDD